MYQVKFKPSAKKSFESLDNKIKKQVANKINQLADNPENLKPEKIQGSDSFYRVRSGDYRIIYEIIDNELVILVVKIGHRREIYKKI